MVSSAVAELDASLQAMLGLKPPGVSGTRILSLTKLCLDNVQSESVLIQKMYTHFKKTPATHKLGVLYVVDSVTRKWLEQAKLHGQPVDSSAPDGTYAAGVYRVTELMPVLMNELLHSAPEGQKDKIAKLLDIWDKGQTFAPAMIVSFRKKLEATPVSIKSTTPEGSPPPGLVEYMGYSARKPAAPAAPAATTAQKSSAIIEALANLARQQNTTAPLVKPAVAIQNPTSAQNPVQSPNQNAAYNVLSNLQKVASQQQQAGIPLTQAQPSYSMPTISQPASAPAVAQYPYAPPQPPVQPQAQPIGMQYAGALPQLPAVPTIDPNQLLLFKTLVDQGVPLNQIPSVLAALNNAQNGAAFPAPAAAVAGTTAPATIPASNYYGTGQGWGGQVQPEDRRGRARSPSGYQGRSRSRSPGRRWDSRGSPRANRENDSDQGLRSPNRGRYDDRGSQGHGNDYRQRSPVGRNGRTPTSRSNSNDRLSSGEKWVEYDQTIPKGHIKVLSRTLFVGGVIYSERELRDIFSKYGQVQSCIVNKEKRHAFVKMISRQDAIRAKDAMETYNGDPQLRTRWGVGFGPRDCSDYQTGISVIPISKLTEADRKWMLTAEYGGSGGRPIESGLVTEEPDIEIGAGVSSKAISRRMQTDKSGHHGPRSTRSGRDDDRDETGRYKRNRDRREEQASGANAQPLPQQFPFGIGTLPNGMPSFPPGFMFPAPDGH